MKKLSMSEGGDCKDPEVAENTKDKSLLKIVIIVLL